ncbi:MAG: hypothetical protein RLP12_14950, partial [Ekhidna sp.]
QTIYKAISIAAVLVVVLLLGILYLPTSVLQDDKGQIASYNALLSNDIDFNSYYSHNFRGTKNMDLGFQPDERVNPTNHKMVTEDGKESSNFKLNELKSLRSKRPSASLAQVSNEIYPYHSGVILSARRSRHEDDKKVWAGVEAGAGTFNTDFGGSGTLANSLNPLGLAAAVGSGSFVNPTTNVSQNMNDAIATTIGFDFGVQFGKKWTLESGLAYTSVENNGTASINVIDIYSIDKGNLISQDANGNGTNVGEVNNPGISSREGSREIEENFDHEIVLNNNVQFASIPIKAGYFIVNNRFSMRVNAGLSANYFMDGSISDPSRKIVNNNDLGLYNDWSFDGIGGLELGYAIFEKFDITVEPNYRHSITPISNSANSPSRILVQTGLRYTLR